MARDVRTECGKDELMQASDSTLDQSSSLPRTSADLSSALGQSHCDEPALLAAGRTALSLRQNFTWAFLGNAIFAACQWGNLVVLAKLADSATVGWFALALAVTAPIFMLTNLQLRGVQATDARGTYRFGHYMALRFACTLLGMAVLPVVLVVSGYGWRLSLVFLAVGLGKAFDSMNDIAFGMAQRNERLDRAAWGRMLAGACSLLGLSLLAWTTGDLVWASLGWSAGHGIALALAPLWIGTAMLADGEAASTTTRAEPNSWSALAPIWDRAVLIRLTMLSLPLGIAMMLVSLYFNVPRYFIEDQLGAEALGIFAALAYLMVAGHMVVVAVGQAATPRWARQFVDGHVRGFVALLAKLSFLAALGSALGIVVAWFWGDVLLTILYTGDYAQHQWLLVVLAGVASVQFVASLFGDAMTATRCFRSQVPLLVAVVAVTALACYALIPRFGLVGAALASGVGAVCQLAGFACVVGYALRQRAKGAL